MSAHYIYFIIFFCIAYLILTDASISKAFYLLTELVKVQYQKVKWWVWMNPKMPWAKYMMWRRSMKLAKEMMEEFESKNK
jgi:hypothetical protein